jgi:pimeloyl-ACP methyl ester carboxylesterase
MERRKLLGALTGTSLGVLLNGSLSGFAQAQSTTQAPSPHSSRISQFPPNSTIILVHAAWADGSCWRDIILPLERRGLHVICAPIPLTSLTNDATALSQVVERTSDPVVLVGHAYSGAVIAAVRDDRVKSLVYITALAPDEGETVAKVFYLNPNSTEAPKMVPDSQCLVWLPDDAFSRAITHKASADESKIAAALQRPLEVHCIQELAPTPT